MELLRYHKANKKTLAAKCLALICTIALITVLFSGCLLTSGDMIHVSFTLENRTAFEITEMWFHSAPKHGSSSPIHEILASGDESFKTGEERTFTLSLYENQIEDGGLLYIKIAEKEESILVGTIYLDKSSRLIITADDDGSEFYVTIYNDSISGSNDAPDEDGIISGSSLDGAEDYIGWWQLDDTDDDISFFYIEITGDVVHCYSETGLLVDAGWFDYNTQRVLNGNPLIVLVLNDLGEYAAYPYTTSGGLRMNINEWNGDASGLFVRVEKPNFSEAVAHPLEGLSEMVYYVELSGNADEEFYPAISFHPNGTFEFFVNLYEHMGWIQGTFEHYEENIYDLTVVQRTFFGYDGDYIEVFSVQITDDTLIYLSGPIGMTENEAVFQKSNGVPVSVQKYVDEHFSEDAAEE